MKFHCAQTETSGKHGRHHGDKSSGSSLLSASGQERNLFRGRFVNVVGHSARKCGGHINILYFSDVFADPAKDFRKW